MPVSPEIVAGLRNSPKGQLVYDRHWFNEGRLNEVLNEASENLKYTCLRPSCEPVLNQVLKAKSPNSPPPFKEDKSLFNGRKVANPDLQNDYVEFTKLDEELHKYENQRRLKIQEVFNNKRDVFSRHSNESYQRSVRCLEVLRGRRKLEDELRAKVLETKQQVSKNASQERRQKLKDEHVSLAKLSEERLKEAALKDKLDEETAHKRKLEFQAKVNAFIQCKQYVYTTYREIAELITSCRNVQLLSEDVRLSVQTVNEIANTIHKIVDGLSHGRLDQKDIDLAGSFQDRVASSLAVVKAGVELVNKRLDDEEATRSTAAAAAAAAAAERRVASPPAYSTTEVQEDTELSLLASTSSLKRYLHYMELLERNRESYRDLSTNASLKKYRFELQKAINTPVNAISSQSGSHLRDKLDRLSNMLAGHPIDASDQRISVADHPQGRLFCLDLLAQKFVRQGVEQVSSSHEAAFPFAAVIIGLWSKEEAFGELLLAHFFAACPFLVPYHMSRQAGQSDQEYYASLGYNVTDGVLEQSNKFLKRMSGFVRLYAAILQSPLPQGISPPHPHGLENGWTWLARILNTDPLPDVTATVLFHFLEVCGHGLHQRYGKQFQKLIFFLCQDYFPKIRSVTPPDSGGPISRLETFLQKCLRQGQILPPEGTLPSTFWFS